MQKQNEWTIPETAEFLGRSERSIRRWIAQGVLSARSERNLGTGRVVRFVNCEAAIDAEARMHQAMRLGK